MLLYYPVNEGSMLLQAKRYTMLIIWNRDVRNDNYEAAS